VAGRVDRGFLALTVVYLSFVALLPFPTGVLGEFGQNPTSVIAFALNMGPVAFVVPWLAIVMWFLAIPLGMFLGRRRPADAARYVA
jgi:uncharacterized membrane protein